MPRLLPAEPQVGSSLMTRLFPAGPQVVSSLMTRLFPAEPQVGSSLMTRLFPAGPQVVSSLMTRLFPAEPQVGSSLMPKFPILTLPEEEKRTVLLSDCAIQMLLTVATSLPAHKEIRGFNSNTILHGTTCTLGRCNYVPHGIALDTSRSA